MWKGHEAETTYWDDLRAPATGINPPGQVSDPDFDVTYGGWLFAASVTETLIVHMQMPHAWKEGSVIRPHVHWMKTTAASGAVMWEIDYRWAPIGEVMDSSWTTLTASTPAVGDNDLADEHALTSFTEIDATGKGLSDMLLVKLSRLGGDAADTYGAYARMMEFDIHYQLDDPGSRQEYSKT